MTYPPTFTPEARLEDALARVRGLERQRDEAAAETAEMLEFLKVHLGWEWFWADGFVGEEHRSQSKQNAQKLRAFLDARGHGLKFLARAESAEKALAELADKPSQEWWGKRTAWLNAELEKAERDLAEARDEFIDGLQKAHEELVEAQARVMRVAEAVRDACAREVDCEDDYSQAVRALPLAAIVKAVKP